MKKFIPILMLGLFTASCVTNKQQSEMRPFSFEVKGEGKIQAECDLINKTGDIISLLEEIRQDTRSVLRILDRKFYPGIENTVHEYAEKIKANSELVIRLAKEDWTKPHIRQTIKWVLTDKDFSKNQYVYDPLVKSVYFQGQERPDLVERVSIDQNGNNFVIEYLNVGTMLEYCQLNETLMLVVEMRTGSFKRPGKKFFNLHVNLEK